MNKIKKAIRFVVFICLIILAGLGVGLSGGIPLPFSNNNRRNSEGDRIELIENKEEDSDSQIP